MVQLLNASVKQFADTADERIIGDETIKLVAVNREMTFALVLPDVALIDGDSDQVRHYVGETMIVIAFNPDDLNAALSIGELTNLREEEPVITVQTPKVEVGKDIAQKDQAAVGAGFENGECIPGSTDFRSEVYVRQEQRVAPVHVPIVAKLC